MPEEKPNNGDNTLTTSDNHVETHKPLSNSQLEPSTPSIVAPTTPDRSELVSRARTFLTSPQIFDQDLSAKRRFLIEKGLNESEVEGLLRELPIQMPAIPPRTYPQLPPSNLPNLLIGLARLFSWVAGGSAALTFIYYYFLLPRITNTSQARRAIKTHHLSLMRRLTTSLASLKESQAESYSALPRTEPYREPPQFAACHSVDDILKHVGDDLFEIPKIPPITFIRCGIEDFSKGKDESLAQPTTEELFQCLEDQVSWLVSENGLQYEKILWETLSTSPLFTSTGENSPDDEKLVRWAYTPPAPQGPSPVLQSLIKLSSSFPTTPRQSIYQHTLQSLADFTGYITTQIYLPYRPNSMGFPGSGNALSPPEEEFRREIRALKGLVLNRRSFMPALPKPNIPPPPSFSQ